VRNFLREPLARRGQRRLPDVAGARLTGWVPRTAQTVEPWTVWDDNFFVTAGPEATKEIWRDYKRRAGCGVAVHLSES